MFLTEGQSVSDDLSSEDIPYSGKLWRIVVEFAKV